MAPSIAIKHYAQEDGFDYMDTFSPVVKITTVQLLLSIAISQQWHIHQLDISNAFLHGDLTEQLYMSQTPGFINSQFPNFVCKLKKSLYGLKQAPQEWFKKLSLYLISIGFQGSKNDSSLFFKYHNSTPYFFLIYVDDILLISPDPNGITTIISLLKKVFTTKDLGSANFFLGIELLKTSTGYFLSQSRYALSILKKLKMDNTKPISNPCSFSETATSNYSVGPTLYRSTVGALQYLTITRPDISFAVNRACQSMHNPSPLD